MAGLCKVCAGLPDQRKGKLPGNPAASTMADIGLSAFSLFFMGSPSFLAHQRASWRRDKDSSNCQTLFGISAIPSDNYIRQMLDGAPATAAFDGLFIQAIETPEVLTPFQRLGGRILIALDGTEHLCSRKVLCLRGARRASYSVGATSISMRSSAPASWHRDTSTILPLAPEFIAPQDWRGEAGLRAQRGKKRWLARHGMSTRSLTTGFSRRRSVRLSADRRGRSGRSEGEFHLTCKPSMRTATITEYLYGAKLEEHRETVVKRGKRTTTVYHWLCAKAMPLRGAAAPMR